MYSGRRRVSLLVTLQLILVCLLQSERYDKALATQIILLQGYSLIAQFRFARFHWPIGVFR